jgi:hypothetical protein
LQPLDHSLCLTQIQRLKYFPSVEHPSRYPKSALRRDDVGFLAIRQIVEAASVLPPNYNDVLKAVIGNQGRPGALSFQNGVGGHSGSVDDLSAFARCNLM